jgi:ribosomal RNA-processing protein 36
MAGEFSAQKFNNNYGFLKDFHTNELTTLKDSLKRARKRLESASRDLRPQYEEEIEKLNLAVKRAESAVNKDRREHTESEAMRRVVADERQKRQQGKGAWWLKRCESFRVVPLIDIAEQKL